MEQKTALLGMTSEEICAVAKLSPPFRGRQIFKWIATGASSFEEMTNIDKVTQQKLSASFAIYSSTVSQTIKDADGTIKLQITLADGRAVETVLLTDINGRKTACVSSQAGCAMACAFCQTGALGLARNLTAGEIVEQFLHLEKVAGKLDNIVFMGMGEPLQNLDAVLKSVQILSSKEGRALSARRITVSTCGLIDGIHRLSESPIPLRLAVSLTTADAALREALMPVAKGNPLPALKEAIARYSEKTKSRVTLEAALLKGKNTGKDSARRLIDFAQGLNVYINLIPWNPVPGLDFSTPSAQECERFLHYLQDAHLNVSLRTRRGERTHSACGQLGRTLMGISKNCNF